MGRATAADARSGVPTWRSWRAPIATPSSVTQTSSASAAGPTGRNRTTAGDPLSVWTIASHAQALKTPLPAATSTASGAGTAAVSAPATLSSTNTATSHPVVRSGGASRHQLVRTTPWWVTSAMTRNAGTPTKNSHSSETTANANITATHANPSAATIAT